MRSLALKLTLAFLLVSLTVTALVAFFARRSTVAEFDRYVWDQAESEFVVDATVYYQTNGSWMGVSEYLHRQAQARSQQPGDIYEPSPPPPPFLLVDQNGYILIAPPPYRPGDHILDSELEQGITIEVEGQVVGTVLATDTPPDRDPMEDRYLARTNRALLGAALGTAGVALFLGILLARMLTRPLRELTTASRAIARGELEQQVPVRSRDELGELAASFNQMSADLAQANELRRQMTADIAHDLRTPLTVITGYIESLRDGTLKSTPARFEVMYNEAQHLKRLVEDLRTLSLADAGELTLNRLLVPPQALLERLAAAYKHQAEQQNIALQVQTEPDLPAINVDPERMMQVLGNLISNALWHTPEGGQIVLSAQRQVDAVLLTVQDNGAGIAPEVLPRIFDRFYRGDESRQQKDGQSGLGLAIAKSLVEAHGGRVSAISAGIGCGSTFFIYLPLASLA